MTATHCRKRGLRCRKSETLRPSLAAIPTSCNPAMPAGPDRLRPGAKRDRAGIRSGSAHRQAGLDDLGGAPWRHPEEARKLRDAQHAVVDDLDHARHRRGAPVDSRRDEGLQPEAAGQFRQLPGRPARPHHPRRGAPQRHGHPAGSKSHGGSMSAATTTRSRGPAGRARPTPAAHRGRSRRAHGASRRSQCAARQPCAWRERRWQRHGADDRARARVQPERHRVRRHAGVHVPRRRGAGAGRRAAPRAEGGGREDADRSGLQQRHRRQRSRRQRHHRRRHHSRVRGRARGFAVAASWRDSSSDGAGATCLRTRCGRWRGPIASAGAAIIPPTTRSASPRSASANRGRTSRASTTFATRSRASRSRIWRRTRGSTRRRLRRSRWRRRRRAC